MNATLNEIIAKKKQKELEAAKIAEKLAKAKKYKELKRQQQSLVSSSNSSLKPWSTSPASTAITATPSPAKQVTADGKENQQLSQANVSGAEESPCASKRSRKSRIKPDSLSQAGNLVRDSCDPHTPIWVPGLSYPAQYCIRQTRSLSQKLQVDNVDCINLDDCMFGSQRMTTPKVKQEDSGSENGVTSAEVAPKPLRRKSGRRGKRRKQRSKQTMSDSTGLTDSNNSDYGMLSGNCTEQPVVPVEDMSLCMAQSPTGDKLVPMSQQALGGSDDDMGLFSAQQNDLDNVLVSSTQQSPGGNNNMMVQQPSGGNDDVMSPVTWTHTEDNEAQLSRFNNDKAALGYDMTSQQPLEGDNNLSVDNLIQELTGQPSTEYDKDLTLYGITESMLMSPDMQGDRKTVVGVAGSCRFWCEQADDLNNKVVVSKSETSSSMQHCTVLKHSVDGRMLQVERLSNIISSSNGSVYLAVLLGGRVVVWLHQSEWSPLCHWAVEKLDVPSFSILPITGGVAVCTIATSGAWRVSFIQDDSTSATTEHIVTQCVCSSSHSGGVVCSWANPYSVWIAVSCRSKIVLWMIGNFSDKCHKQCTLPLNGEEVCSLCGMENCCTASQQGAWLAAATPTSILMYDVIGEHLLQQVPLICSNSSDPLFPKCLRAIREDQYTFIVLGYKCQQANTTSHSEVGWLVAIDNSNDTRSSHGMTDNSQSPQYAKLLREYKLPALFNSSDDIHYLNSSCDQLVVATATPPRVCSWDQLTGVVNTTWSLTDFNTGNLLIQGNSTTLVVGDCEAVGQLYIYRMDN